MTQDISYAKKKLLSLVNKTKYETMTQAAAIITEILDSDGIKPIIVGGLSVEIYSQQAYSTRDIDFVSDGYEKIEEVLLKLGFKKEGRHFYHETIEVAVEIPDSYLAGDYERVIKVELDNGQYIYLISIEDIILDRLRAGIHWHSEDDLIWSFSLLNDHYDTIDIQYLKEHTETNKEKIQLETWINEINSLNN